MILPFVLCERFVLLCVSLRVLSCIGLVVVLFWSLLGLCLLVIVCPLCLFWVRVKSCPCCVALLFCVVAVNCTCFVMFVFVCSSSLYCDVMCVGLFCICFAMFVLCCCVGLLVPLCLVFCHLLPLFGCGCPLLPLFVICCACVMLSLFYVIVLLYV